MPRPTPNLAARLPRLCPPRLADDPLSSLRHGLPDAPLARTAETASTLSWTAKETRET